MKRPARRHAASLAFIGFLAVIYLIILLTRKGETPQVPSDKSAGGPSVAVSDTSARDNGISKKATQGDNVTKSHPGKRKKEKTGTKRRKPLSYPDNPDVLDLPIPSIHR